MKPQKVMLIYGARRVGKTVLLKDIMSRQAGKVLLLNGESSETMDMMDSNTHRNSTICSNSSPGR
ncbi:MAG: AAA family ATPase [Muribaculaceae bacterium]|nr:AAA family ATPase [Muribaculaceae bacterium]